MSSGRTQGKDSSNQARGLTAGDCLTLRKGTRTTTVAVEASPTSPDMVSFTAEGKTYATLYDALLELFRTGWSGATISTQRKHQLTNSIKTTNYNEQRITE